MSMQALLQKVQGWYGNIPPLESPAFMKFLGNVGYLIKYVAQTDRPIAFLFANIGTAGADLESGRIILPLWVLDVQTYQTFYPDMDTLDPTTDNALVTGLFNGFSIHEAAHHRYTKLSKVAVLNGWFPKANLDQKLALACVDLTEDLYIETQIRQQRYGLFIDVLDEFLFPPLLTEEWYEKFGQEPTSGNLMSTLLGFKNAHTRDLPLWQDLADLVALMEQVQQQHHQADRAQTAAEIYQKIRDEVQQAGGNPDAQQDDSAGAHRKIYDGGKSADTSPQQKNVANMLQGINPDLEDEGEKIAQEINKLMETPDEFNIKPVRVVDIMDNPYPTRQIFAHDITPAATFKNLGTLLRLLKADNITPGVPRKFGRKIVNTRLTRIVTDQKIFGDPRIKQDKNDREVILLVDHSGSMSGRIEKTMKAARGAFDSLRESSTPCAVYGHSCLGSQPMVYHIASFRMKVTSSRLPDRWDAARKITMEENYDGVAIDYCAKQFSKRNNPKILIVFCDGLPTGPGYRGTDSVEHTKRAIQDARKRGILVFSVSLVAEIVENNNEFYGKAFNINASRGNVDEALRTMLLKWGV